MSLEVRLLGQFAVAYRGRPITGIDSPRMQSLFAYLLLHRAPQSRRHLAFVLWPDSREEQARTNLRQLLFHLRKALPDADTFIVADAKNVQLNGDVELDVVTLESLLDTGEPERAVALYRGALLPSCYDEWITADRERIATRVGRALRELATTAAGRGDHESAIRWGRQRVQHDPLDEAAYFDLMRAHAAAGQRAEAVRVFHACAAALESELGVGPSPATRQCFESLMPEREATPARGASRAYIGRAAELAALEAALDAGGWFALIEGEPGIGKSRLAEEVSRIATRRGFAVAACRTYPTTQRLAYAPVAEWLRSPTIAPSLASLEPAWTRELERVLPELGSRGGEPLQRLRLFEAMARAVCVARVPRLLVIDDLQWCDQETLDWLAFLLRFEAPAPAPVCVLATARTGEIDPRWVQGFADVRRIELRPLAHDETLALAASVGGDVADAERLYRDTGGNPLFVIELARSARSPRVGAVIEARVAELSPAARELVELAAAIGREFSVPLLEAASGVDEQALVRALDEAWSRRLVRERGDGYDFTHDKIRDEAYRHLTPARKGLIHHNIARALERTRGSLAEIAVHYDRAGRRDEAINRYQQAAQAAQRVYANAEAVALLERALELAGGNDIALLVALGVPLVALHGYGAPRVLEVYQRAYEVCEETQTTSAPVLRALAIARLVRRQFRETEELGHRLAVVGDAPARVEADYVLGVAAFWMGRFADARRHLEHSIANISADQLPLHRELYAQDPEVVCSSRLAVTLWHLGAPYREVMQRALELAQARQHGFSLAYVLHWNAWLHALAADDALLAAAEQSLRFSLEHEFPYWHTQSRILVGWARRDREEIERGLREYTDTGTQLGWPYYLALYARLLAEQGERERAEAVIAEALAAVGPERWAEPEVARAAQSLSGVGR